MKYTIILLALFLVGCVSSQPNKPCETECVFSVGDMVNFRGQEREFIIDDVNDYGCKCTYDGHYFDDRGERQYSIYIDEYEVEPIEGEDYTKEYDPEEF